MSGGARHFWYGAVVRRGARWVGARVRRIDVRKPVHALTIVVLLAGIVAPVAQWLVTNERYRLTDPMAAVVERPAPKLMDKLRYDKEKRANIFNPEGRNEVRAEAKDALQTAVGAGGKKDKQLYTATMPDDASQGIDIRDNVNDVSVKFVPLVSLLGGRSKNGRVSYPLKDQAGMMVFTPKANGVKEDIVLTEAPRDDTVEYRYKLEFPESVEARLDDRGAIGFYTGSPELFGNVTYGTDKDRELVDKARKVAQKNYLMFKIPAPVVRETGKQTQVQARFGLEGKELVVRTTGLKKANYPLSIDPTFLVSSTSEFELGSVEDNIDLTVSGQVGRATLSGGSVAGWTVDANGLVSGNYDAALVAYNSAMYLIGGGNQDGTTSNNTTTMVKYVLLNTDGTQNGNWTTTSSLNGARQGHVGFGYNGYIYAIAGTDNSGNPVSTCTYQAATVGCTVEYTKVNSDGTLAAWAPTTGLNTARNYPAGAISQGVLYVMGGATGTGNNSLTATVEYARINADGTVGTWATTTSLPTATNRFIGGAYNGYVYVTGGYQNPGSAQVINTVLYAAIQSDGTLGSWNTTTAFPTARRNHGFAVINGHMYIYAGCSQSTIPCSSFISTTHYAVINADGTVGQWQRTMDYNYNSGGSPFGPRTGPASAYYNGYLHFVGGCANEVNASNPKCTNSGLRTGTFYTGFDVPGRFDRGIATVQTTQPYNNNAATVARMGARGVALNGYLYLIGGCSVTNCNTATSYTSTVEYAAINSDGSLGTFATTSALISTSGGANNAGRVGHAVVAYNNKVYVIGGVERTTGNADSYRGDVISATQNSNGTLGTFAAETNSLTSGPGVNRAFGTAEVWHDRIFYIGGLSSSTTVSGTIYRTQISSNAPGTWSATTTGLTNARWGHSGGIWGNWLYVVGGQSNTTGTYITAANGAEQLTITSSGDITSAASVQNVSGAPVRRLMGGFVHNGVIYTFGGYTSGSTSAVVTISWSQLNASTGALGAWSTNIGNAITCTSSCPTSGTYGLATARGQTTAVNSSGNFYVMGGCTSTLATTSFSACSSFVSTTNASEVYLVNNGGTGQAGSFSSATSLSSARADQASVAYNGKLYVLGGCTSYASGACNSAGLTTVQSVDINPDGALAGSWTTETALPGERSGLQAAAYNGYLYVVGGRSNSSATTDTVWYTTIGATGTLGSWTDDSGNYLPSGQDRRAFGLAISNGYLYVAGGQGSSGLLSNVYYAPLDTSTGDVGNWTSTSAFTTARANHNLVTYNGVLYVVGGHDGTNALRDVQFAPINSDGSVGTWAYTTDVYRAMNVSQTVAANGYMYFIGNEGDRTEVHYAGINANGRLGMLQRSDAQLAGAHAHGAASWFDGFLYVSGACAVDASGNCNAAPTTSVEKVGTLGISRTGHYSKLFDTQVDTSPTQLVINGAVNGPGALVELKFQTASQSDPVLGVAQLIRPVIFGNFYNVQALNSSGTNVGVAFNYQYIITLDDSRSATFPDVPNSGGGYGQTAVTDITLYYHANPGRRLRHGASFTNTGCNVTVSEGCILDTAP